MQTFLPIISYYQLNNNTFNVGYSHGDFFYQFNVDDFTVETINFGDKIFEMEPGSTTLHLRLSGIDLQSRVNGNFTLFNKLKLINMESTQLNLTNITMDIKLNAKADADNVHWTLGDESSFHFDTLRIQMKNSILQKLVDLNSGLIAKMINFELRQVGKVLDKKV